MLDHADYTAPTGQHELDRTDQEHICPVWQIWVLDWGVGHLPNVSDIESGFHVEVGPSLVRVLGAERNHREGVLPLPVLDPHGCAAR